MTSEKSSSNIFVTTLIAKRWNKFFYRNPKGTIDPDLEWKQQIEQRNDKIYKMVNFDGKGEFVTEYDKGKTPEEKKKCIQDYFKKKIEGEYLCKKTNQSVEKQQHEQWYNGEIRKVKGLIRKKTNQRKMSLFSRVQFDGGINSDDNRDHVMKCYEKHEVKWRLHKRGPVGETPIHLLFLNGTKKHIAIAEALLEKYPELAMDFYEGMEYHGKTCLHFAIMQNNKKAVKILLDTDKVDIHACARGRFFVPVDINRGDVKLRKHKYEGYAYYGEYPLSFAASIGNQEI